MRPFTKKSRFKRLVDTATDALDRSGGPKLSVPSDPGKALKKAVPKDKAAKAGLIAGGVAALTAGSAGISALRRRAEEGARDDS